VVETLYLPNRGEQTLVPFPPSTSHRWAHGLISIICLYTQIVHLQTIPNVSVSLYYEKKIEKWTLPKNIKLKEGIEVFQFFQIQPKLQFVNIVHGRRQRKIVLLNELILSMVTIKALSGIMICIISQNFMLLEGITC
jgi:hypothetical protein